jgi:hypothetical protein
MLDTTAASWADILKALKAIERSGHENFGVIVDALISSAADETQIAEGFVSFQADVKQLALQEVCATFADAEMAAFIAAVKDEAVLGAVQSSIDEELAHYIRSNARRPKHLAETLSVISRFALSDRHDFIIQTALDAVTEAGRADSERIYLLECAANLGMISSAGFEAHASEISSPLGRQDFVDAFQGLARLSGSLADVYWQVHSPKFDAASLYAERQLLVPAASCLTEGWDEVCLASLHQLSQYWRLEELNALTDALTMRAKIKACAPLNLKSLAVLAELMRHHREAQALVLRNAPQWRLWELDGADSFVSAIQSEKSNYDNDLLAKAVLLCALQRFAEGAHLLRNARSKFESNKKVLNQILYSSLIFPLDAVERYASAKTPPASVEFKDRPVLIICERNALPSVLLSADLKASHLTVCTMDSDLGRHGDVPDEYWSLRDLSFDASSVAKAQTAHVRLISEAVMSRYQMYNTLTLSSERNVGFQRPLATAIEDSLDGQVVMARCILTAIENFSGEDVILCLKNSRFLDLFESSFLATGKRLFVNFPRLTAEQDIKSLMKPREPAKTSSSATISKYMAALDDLTFHGAEQKVQPTGRPTVAVMSAFTDRIYVENVVPMISSLLENYDVCVIESDAPAACRAVLVDAFGPAFDQHRPGKNQLRFVDINQDLSEGLVSLKNSKVVMETLARETISNFAADIKTIERLDIGGLLETSLGGVLNSTAHRLGVAARMFRAVFSAGKFDGLYVSSERLPIRMTAVQAGREAGTPTVDVMSVNSVNLLRYRPAVSDILTSIDTITSEFLSEFYGVPSSRIALTGSPRFARIIESIECSDEAETRRRLGISSSEKVILYACQLQPIDRCVDILRQLVSVAEASPSITLIVKLHRRENFAREKIYEAVVAETLARDRIHIIGDDPYFNNIAHSMRVSNVVVSLYSNAIREAACVGIPVVAADWFETPLPFDFPGHGLGARASSPDELQSIVLSLLESGPSAEYEARSHAYKAANPQLFDDSAAGRIASVLEKRQLSDV